MLLNRQEVSLLLLFFCHALGVVKAVNAEKDALAEQAKEWATSGEPQLPLPSKSGGASARIINGNNAPPFRYEYAVSLQNRNFHFCGGSLIAPNIILSAAHCAPSSTNGILANINNFDLDNPGPNGQNAEEISVSTFRTHPAYDLGTSLSNDFMLLKLSSSSSNPLVRLNSNSNDPQTSDPELTVVGWGTTVEGVNRPPDVLQQVKVEYITNDACKNSYGSRSVSSDMMCCREAGQGSCQGDSGGPLVIKGNDGEGTDVQVGVVSWGFDCALANYPGVYSRVSSGWSWIRENVCEMADGEAPDYFECADVPPPPVAPPTVSPAPTLPKASVYVEIKLDSYPQEFGWRIANQSNDIIIQHNPGTYILPYQVVEKVVELNSAETYVLQMVDQAADGICCQYGGGKIAVYLGAKAASDKLLLSHDGIFTSELDIEFTVSNDGILVIDGGDSETPSSPVSTDDEAEYIVKFKTDLYPAESSWAIQTLRGQEVYAGFPSAPDAVETTIVNLMVGETYVFTISDVFGDGLCCTFGDGEASIYYGTSAADDELELVKMSGEFGFEKSAQFVAVDLGGNLVVDGSGGETPETFGCFPSTAKVQVEGQGTVLMKDVKLGDRVLVDGSGNNKYESVYSFAHRVEEGQEEFQKLVTSKATLELTKGHLVFLEGGRSVPASMVTAGDKLELASGEFDIVKSVKTVVREGLYAPFTASGTIIVNGIKASTFIALQESETLKIGSFDTGLTYHSVSHSFERPHRVWCEYFSGCTSEGRTAEGVSVWVDIPHKIARWAFAQDSMLYSSVPLALLLLLAYPLAVLGPLLLAVTASRRLSLRVKSLQ